MLFNKFILASSSSSRYKILKNNKLFFSKINPTCNENILKKKLIKKKTTPKKISLELARLKSKSISIKKTNSLVLGCDTIISLNGKVLNKAKNKKEAKNKIGKMLGKKHFIYSSASVYQNHTEVWKTTQTSIVKIRQLTKKEINQYLLMAGNSVLSSVGCYQIEVLGPNIIENIKGDFFNVMGFPLFPFLKFLKRYRVKR